MATTGRTKNLASSNSVSNSPSPDRVDSKAVGLPDNVKSNRLVRVRAPL